MQTIKAFRNCLVESDVFVFTLGLTERWINTLNGYEYPICPGTVAGEYSEKYHDFSNLSYIEVYEALVRTMNKIKSVNKNIKFLFTVSPVPLTATNSKQHVVVATMSSKSTLRSVADAIIKTESNADYFPSYEIICSPFYRGAFFEPNVRTVSRYGVNHVMNVFFDSLHKKYGKSEIVETNVNKEILTSESFQDLPCEEQLLDAFG